MAQTLAELLELLTLKRTGNDTFVGRSPAEHAFTRVFGGQLFAQMLIAANNTVGDDREVHSMHAYFLRPGHQHTPIDFKVSRGLDGRSFSNRTVIATQEGRQICNFAASFATPAEGPEFQEWQPTVPGPELLQPMPDFREQYEQVMSYVAGTEAIEFRFEEGITDRNSDKPGQWKVWFRVNGDLPDVQGIHSALVAYASDIFLLETTLRPHDVGWLDDVDFATIDYSMWFHRPFRLEGWNLLAFGAAMARGGRALSYGELFDHDRIALASMTQEGMTRFKPGRAADLGERIRKHSGGSSHGSHRSEGV